METPMKNLAKSILSIYIFALSAVSYAENMYTGIGKITLLENGWNGEGINIIHSGAGVTGCNPNPQEFALSKDHPSYKELVSFTLAAHTASANVELVVEKGVCLFGNRTKIISIKLIK